MLNQFSHLKAFSEEVILIKLQDHPGALAKIARRFKDADINMRSIRIVQRSQGECVVAISVERSVEALNLLQDVILK